MCIMLHESAVVFCKQPKEAVPPSSTRVRLGILSRLAPCQTRLNQWVSPNLPHYE